MKALTIHGIDNDLNRQLEKAASKEGLSLNRIIKTILKEHFGLSSKTPSRNNDFKDLFGVWTAKEHKEFQKNTAVFERIDAEHWK